MSASASPFETRYGTELLRTVEQIPARGANVIVATRHTGELVKAGILYKHGPERLKRCRFYSVPNRGGLSQLEGIRGPVVLAHCFRLGASIDLLMRVTQLACAVHHLDGPRPLK